MTSYHLPTRPMSPIDALNRRAIAMGHPDQWNRTAGANYNGHHVTVCWNDYRCYYVAEYYYGGRVVLARGSFADCLAAALSEFRRGALGASVGIETRGDDAEAAELCERTPELVLGPWPREAEWWTWRHRAAAESVRDYANPRSIRRVFDWELMQAAETLEQYEAAIKAKHGRVWTF